MKSSAAEILREYRPFPQTDHVHGVTFDGQSVWFASGDKLNAFDPVVATQFGRLRLPHMRGRLLTGGIFTKSLKIASRK